MHRTIIFILLAASLLAAAWSSAPSSGPTTDAGCILDPSGTPGCAHGS